MFASNLMVAGAYASVAFAIASILRGGSDEEDEDVGSVTPSPPSSVRSVGCIVVVVVVVTVELPFLVLPMVLSLAAVVVSKME